MVALAEGKLTCLGKNFSKRIDSVGSYLGDRHQRDYPKSRGELYFNHDDFFFFFFQLIMMI